MIPISAKAEATLDIKAEIPSSAVGRLVDTLTDLIRPVTERLGLDADKISLERAHIKAMISKISIETIIHEQIRIKNIELKNLIPILEKASLEKMSDKDMIERWSALIISATTSDNFQPRFVQILSELNGRRARFLEDKAIAFLETFQNVEDTIGSSVVRVENQRIDFSIDELLHRHPFLGVTEKFDELIKECIEAQGSFLTEFIFYNNDDDISVADYFGEDNADYKQIKLDIEVLTSIGLLSRNILQKASQDYKLSICYYSVTDLGLAFFNAVDPRPLFSKKIG